MGYLDASPFVLQVFGDKTTVAVMGLFFTA
jgi:hypothetical protein